MVSYFVGDRGIKSCQAFWDWVPEEYKSSFTFSDFWEAYATVIDNGKHQMVGKETGETATYLTPQNIAIMKQLGAKIYSYNTAPNSVVLK